MTRSFFVIIAIDCVQIQCLRVALNHLTPSHIPWQVISHVDGDIRFSVLSIVGTCHEIISLNTE